MTVRTRLAAAAVILAGLMPAPGSAQQAIMPAALKTRLFMIAHDSMGGRHTGSKGSFLTTSYVAAEFKRFGLQPAGDNGTFFQNIPFVHIYPETILQTADGRKVLQGHDVFPSGRGFADWNADKVTAVFGGVVTDSTTWLTAEQAAGRLVIFADDSTAPPAGAPNRAAAASRNPRFAGASAVAVIRLDAMPVDTRSQRLYGAFTTTPQPVGTAKLVLLMSNAGAAKLLPRSPRPGQTGTSVTGTIRVRRDSTFQYPPRNVVAILPGSDPALRNTYVTLTAHSDHVGFVYTAADHDSVYAYNRVIRVMGADTPDRTPTPAEAARITAIRDSLKRIRPSYRDSIFNGADDDGTGTVALLEVARALSAGPRPARSILFVSHTAEEVGLLGSRWFTDHATVPRDSIISEMDMDMIGRGNEVDVRNGSPQYLEVVGSRRLSREYGDILEQVNARQPLPFKFNYEFDQPGHPLQYYCRADHYGYARHGIPAFAVSRGEHADYHQVTDEPEYIDYNGLARVANLALDFVRTIAALDHRPALDGPKQDPNAPCRQ